MLLEAGHTSFVLMVPTEYTAQVVLMEIGIIALDFVSLLTGPVLRLGISIGGADGVDIVSTCD
jgi:hypothetical protein